MRSVNIRLEVKLHDHLFIVIEKAPPIKMGRVYQGGMQKCIMSLYHIYDALSTPICTGGRFEIALFVSILSVKVLHAEDTP